MTTLAEEQAFHRVWRRRPEYAAMDFFDRLVTHEFVAPEQQRAYQDGQLNTALRLAEQHVPYYRELFGSLGVTAADIDGVEGLPKLPVLAKQTVQVNEGAMQAEQLPPGAAINGWFSSSGTTGRPTRVLRTRLSNMMFTYLNLRSARWGRWRPEGKLAWIRSPTTQVRLPDGSVLPDGATIRGPRWPYIGKQYETGPFAGFNRTNPVEAQLDWLRTEKVNYLLAYAGELVSLAIACDGQTPLTDLKGVQVASTQLTPAMRRRVETGLDVHVGEGYGLNEVGPVALRCDAGRYHVHVENCVVEIVDDEGQPCPPGDTGRVLVSTLCNPSMPLFRYDTGDLAEVTEGPCPCGRTLPCFGAVVGRYFPWHTAPPGTAERLDVVRHTIDHMPSHLLKPMREYLVHQHRDGRFELKLTANGDLPEAFTDAIRKAWDDKVGPSPTLTIEVVDQLPPPPGGKQQEFTSDFFPSRSEA